jgi:hypothetical protein
MKMERVSMELPMRLYCNADETKVSFAGTHQGLLFLAQSFVYDAYGEASFDTDDIMTSQGEGFDEGSIECRFVRKADEDGRPTCPKNHSRAYPPPGEGIFLLIRMEKTYRARLEANRDGLVFLANHIISALLGMIPATSLLSHDNFLDEGSMDVEIILQDD